MDNSFLSDLIITKVYSVSSFYNERGAGSERVNRPSCAVVLKYTGETVYCCHGKNYVSDFCNMALLPKGCSYRWTCSQTGYVYIAEFDCNITADNIYTFPVSCGDKALQLFRQSESCLTKGAPSSKLETVKNLYSLILMLTDSGQQRYISSDKRTYLAPAIDYIAKISPAVSATTRWQRPPAFPPSTSESCLQRHTAFPPRHTYKICVSTRRKTC